jgi:hypothetical protein
LLQPRRGQAKRGRYPFFRYQDEYHVPGISGMINNMSPEFPTY